MVHDFLENKIPQMKPLGCKALFEKKLKFSPLIKVPHICSLGVLKPAEHAFGDGKFLRYIIEGLHINFRKIEILWFCFVLNYMGVINFQKVGLAKQLIR